MLLIWGWVFIFFILGFFLLDVVLLGIIMGNDFCFLGVFKVIILVGVIFGFILIGVIWLMILSGEGNLVGILFIGGLF